MVCRRSVGWDGGLIQIQKKKKMKWGREWLVGYGKHRILFRKQRSCFYRNKLFTPIMVGA
jgi:hypothetical protein